MAVVPEKSGGDNWTADDANQGFHVKSVVYDSTNDELDITVGPGRVDWGGDNITEFTADQVINVAAPATNTTYYVYVESDDTFHTSTSATYDGSAANAVRLASVATGADVSTLTRTDLRGILPIPSVLADVQVFTASGTWTKPSVASIVEVYAIGGGGGGGAQSASGSGGGGGGAHAHYVYDAADLGATETVTVGAGGAGSGTGAGGDGGDSVFSTLTAFGGDGATSSGGGGEGGSGWGGGASGDSYLAGGGGGSDGNNGGDSVFGGGGGAGDGGVAGTSTLAGDGGGPDTNGSVPGGGGGGEDASAGGDGARGEVRIYTWS